MIRNESEYQEASRRLTEERARIEAQQAQLEQLKLPPDQVKRALDPMRSFYLQLEEEVQSYERLKRGDFGEVVNFHGLGRMLVAIRVYLDLTQRELAERLGVHESQVSRDERNEYHGITIERAGRILDALGVEIRSAVTPLPSCQGDGEATRAASPQLAEQALPVQARRSVPAGRFREPSEGQLLRA